MVITHGWAHDFFAPLRLVFCFVIGRYGVTLILFRIYMNLPWSLKLLTEFKVGHHHCCMALFFVSDHHSHTCISVIRIKRGIFYVFQKMSCGRHGGLMVCMCAQEPMTRSLPMHFILGSTFAHIFLFFLTKTSVGDSHLHQFSLIYINSHNLQISLIGCAVGHGGCASLNRIFPLYI